MTQKKAKFKSWQSFRQFSNKAVHESRYFHDQEITDFLTTVIKTSNSRIKSIAKGAILWRAQLGCDTDKRHDSKNKLTSIEFLPFKDDGLVKSPEK